MWSPVHATSSASTTQSSSCTTIGHESDQRCPVMRCKHAMCSSPDGRIYLFGGRKGSMPLKDLWRFDPVQNQWEEVIIRGSLKPPNLQEHTITSWNNKLYVFGGEVGFTANGETPLWILDLGTLTWRKNTTSPDCMPPGSTRTSPSGRRGHSSVLYKDAIHVYGGFQDLRGSSSDLWTFDLRMEEWHLITCSGRSSAQPSGRHYHSAVVHEESMYIFAGMSDLQERNDLWRWNLENKQWQKIKSNKGPGGVHSHTAVNFAGSMFVFGGERKGNLLNELWRFHFASLSWDRISTDGGMIPNPMSRHAAILSSVSQMQQSWSEPERIRRQSCSHHEPAATPAAAAANTALKQSPSCSLPPAPPPHMDHKKALAVVPPKSISMCFGFNHHQSHTNNRNHHQRRNSSRRSQQPLQEMNVVEATRKAIKYFKVHSALSINMCWRDSGITMSDNEEDEEENQTTASKDIITDNNPTDGNSRISSDTGLESESRAISPPKIPTDLMGNNFATVQRRRRKRRPRPFSEQIDPVLFESGGGAAGTAGTGLSAIEDIDMEWPNFGHKRHTVHESMSYYSLCFPSPQLGSVNNSRSLRKNLAKGGTSDRRAAAVHTFGNIAASSSTKSKSKPSPPPPPPPPHLPPPEEISYRKNELFSPDGLDFTLNEFEEDDVLDFRRMSVNFQQPAVARTPVLPVGDEELSPEAEESETSFIEKGEEMITTSTSSSNNCNNNCNESEDAYHRRLHRQQSSDMDSGMQLQSGACMYIFGGREERTTNFPQKQPMAVWKLCLNI